MNILNKLKSSGACFGLCLAGSLLWSRAAAAEVKLVEKDGWTFSFDGRVNAFLSVGQGDDFPNPTPNPNLMPPLDVGHTVMGGGGSLFVGAPQGSTDVGWKSSSQGDQNNKYFGMRVRSGLFGNVLGFGLTKNVTETTTVKGYVSVWSTIETLGRDKWSPLTAEAREGYFDITGQWGDVTVGRTLGWLGRTSTEIDIMYGHGFGLGLPCNDTLGPSCGHIGTGVLFPGYSAGISYTTPSFGGLQIRAGLYDPVVLSSDPSDWSRAPLPRPEGAITFDTPLGTMGKLKIGVEGLYQQLARVASTPNMTPGLPATKSDEKTSMWGASAGVRAELGPMRLGLSGFRGRGIGVAYAGQRSSMTSDDAITTNHGPALATYQLRSSSGFYAQLAAVLGDVHVAAGFGQAIVDQLEADKTNPDVSVFHTQTGISGAVYYHVSDSVVVGLDYFRFMARWYGAPSVDVNMMLDNGKLPGEKQDLNFVNAGVTYHW